MRLFWEQDIRRDNDGENDIRFGNLCGGCAGNDQHRRDTAAQPDAARYHDLVSSQTVRKIPPKEMKRYLPERTKDRQNRIKPPGLPVVFDFTKTKTNDWNFTEDYTDFTVLCKRSLQADSIIDLVNKTNQTKHNQKGFQL